MITMIVHMLNMIFHVFFVLNGCLELLLRSLHELMWGMWWLFNSVMPHLFGYLVGSIVSPSPLPERDQPFVFVAPLNDFLRFWYVCCQWVKGGARVGSWTVRRMCFLSSMRSISVLISSRVQRVEMRLQGILNASLHGVLSCFFLEVIILYIIWMYFSAWQDAKLLVLSPLL